VRVPLADTTLVAVPEEVTAEEALLAGDVFSTGLFAATAGEVGPGDVVAVLGCGPVGLMAALSARLLGATRVLALDRIEERLALARQFGVEAFNFENQSPNKIVAEATESRGADVVLEAVGTQKASRLAVDLVRPGGVVSVVGVHTEPSFDFSPVLAYDKNLTYRIGRCSARTFLDRTLALLSSKSPPISKIISHRLPLAEGEHAYRIFANRTDGCTKAVLIP
jgi:threonine dehydrogenase-like Zn-dependent dehydrogenase